MSPIFVRPVREQLEHDRLVRHLQAKYTRKSDVDTNLGDEQVSPVTIGLNSFFPDLVLSKAGKLVGVVEVETGESVNNLEAMAQWVHFARVRAPFYLYVPVLAYDTTRRICEALGIRPTEVWSYRPAFDSFDLVRMSHDAAAAASTGPRRPPPSAEARSRQKARALQMKRDVAAAAAEKLGEAAATKLAAERAVPKTPAPEKAAPKKAAPKKAALKKPALKRPDPKKLAPKKKAAAKRVAKSTAKAATRKGITARSPKAPRGKKR